jgi:VanZ family protein
MLRLRYPWLWLLLGWALIAGVIYGSLASDTVVRGLPFSDKVVHASSYGLLMTWFAGLYARSRHGWIALVVLTLGLGLEIIQSRLSYRTFDPLDLLANATGVGVGFVLSFWVLAGWCQRLEGRLTSRHAGQ